MTHYIIKQLKKELERQEGAVRPARHTIQVEDSWVEWLIGRVQELEEDLRAKDNMVKTMGSMALHREDKLMSALQSKSSYRKQRNRSEREADVLEQELNRCRETLKFYANPSNYEEVDQYMSNINVDSGVRARRELGNLND